MSTKWPGIKWESYGFLCSDKVAKTLAAFSLYSHLHQNSRSHLHIFHSETGPRCQAYCRKQPVEFSILSLLKIARTHYYYLMAVAFAILLGKATLGAKHPESICSWFSFSKNRTQSSRPQLGKQQLVKGFHHCPVATPSAESPSLPTPSSPEKAKPLHNFWWGILNIKIISKAAQLPAGVLRGNWSYDQGNDWDVALNRKEAVWSFITVSSMQLSLDKMKSSTFMGYCFLISFYYQLFLLVDRKMKKL